jgi:hypothetical protein
LEVNNHLETIEYAPALGASDEPRLRGPFPARVKGVDSGGRRFKTDTALENLSAYDCSLALSIPVERGQRLCISARIGRALIALRCEVSNALLRADGNWNVAVRFTRYRFVHHLKNLD